jgi:WD40 repeat protein
MMRTGPRFIVALFLALGVYAPGLFAQLKLDYPNGGESFQVGTSMTIVWSGIPPTDVVALEYSTDNGTTWNLITNNATNLQYTWTNIPNALSASCLIQVTLPSGMSAAALYLIGNGFYSNADFSSDGNLVLGASGDGYAYIWDSHSTQLLHKFQTETGVGIPGNQTLNHWGMFAPNFQTFATVSPSIDSNPYGNRVRIFDAATGVKQHQWYLYDPVLAFTYGHCYFSPDGSSIAATGLDSICIFDIATEALDAKLAGFVFQSGIYAEYNVASTMDWKPDGTDIIGGIAQRSDSLPTYVRASPLTGDTIQTYRLTSSYPTPSVNGPVHYSPDGTKFIASTQDTAVRVWDVTSGTVLFKIIPGALQSVDAVFSHDGTKIATVASDSVEYNVKLWNASNGSFLGLVGSLGFASGTIEFSPDDTRLLISSDENNIILQVAPSAAQSAVSAGTWSIVPNSGENIVVYTPNVSGNENDFVDIPILINDPAGAVAGGATQVTFTLQFDETMLMPVSPSPLGTIQSNNRVLTYTLPIVATDTILGILHVQVALGDDSITPLTMVGPSTNAPAVTATGNSGTFTLLDVCYADGARLIDPNGVVSMIIPNNPAHDAIEVVLNLIEDGETSLALYDACGRKSCTVFDENITHGARAISVPAQQLPSGVYYLVLQTPNHRLMKPVEVQR